MTEVSLAKSGSRLGRICRLAALCSLLIAPRPGDAAPAGHGVEKLPRDTLTTLDVTQPFEELPPVRSDSSAAEIASGIQARFDALQARQLPGRVYLHAGRWEISRPIFMNGDGKELVGAGVGKTVLAAAAGCGGLPMVNLSARTHFTERPLQSCNRVRLTDPAARVLDVSVPGERYGLRTYAEYPSTQFPAESHLATFVQDAAPWKKGTHYRVNDVISLAPPAVNHPLQAVCTREHDAADVNSPERGAEWKDDWVVKVPFHVQCFADPLTAGAFDPALQRASNWAGMQRFTLDFAFTQNAEPKVYKNGRMLCGVVMGETSRPQGKVWMLMARENGDLTFDVTLNDGSTRSIKLAKGCTAAGTYRLAMQVDFAAQRVQAWVRRPGEADLARTCDDQRQALPQGARFRPVEFGFFTITGADSGSPAAANGSLTPPTDITVCGLHMSADLRYADNERLARRADHHATDDLFRYFTEDDGTTAFLPLTDHPADHDLPTTGMLVTVQHGRASGGEGQHGFAYLKVPASIYGVARQRVSDMTIEPGTVWGAGIVTWHALDPLLCNLDIRGGYYAIGDLFYGAQYTFDVRDCRLSGSEAAFNGASNIVYMHGVTIDPIGRCGVLVSGSNMTLDDVTFGDPRPLHSEYDFRHIDSVGYGGMNLLTHIHAVAPPGSAFPSHAAFSQQNIGRDRTSFVLRDSAVANLGPDAAVVEFPWSQGPCSARMLLERCTYTGRPIAAWVRTDSPWWSGRAMGCGAAADAPVRRLMDWRPPPSAPAWKAGTAYKTGALATDANAVWRCLQDHTADAARPPSKDGPAPEAKRWAPAIPHIVFEPR